MSLFIPLHFQLSNKIENTCDIFIVFSIRRPFNTQKLSRLALNNKETYEGPTSQPTELVAATSAITPRKGRVHRDVKCEIPGTTPKTKNELCGARNFRCGVREILVVNNSNNA